MTTRKQRTWVRRQRLNAAASGLLLTMLVVYLDRLDVLGTLERWFYDHRARLCQFFTPEPSDKVVHLDIDDAALEAVGQWPWPRSVLADILEEVHRAGPKVIALDVLFADRQPLEWRPPGSDPPYVDHDAALARSFRRMGNVLLANSLPVGAKDQRGDVQTAAEQVLTGDLELTAADVTRVLKARGMTDVSLSDTDGTYLAARRDAARLRVLWAINHDPSLLPQIAPGDAVTRPATAPTTRPSGQDSAVSPHLWRLRRQLMKGDVRLGTPVRNVIDAAYERARAERELARHGFPVRQDMPLLHTAAPKVITVPELAAAAAASGFVEYRLSGDDKVRTVPMLLHYDGRVYPQLGLGVAAMMAGADLARTRYEGGALVIPRGGGAPAGPDLVIPVRTHRPTGEAGSIPMLIDIPFVGASWSTMYGEERHFSLARVRQICRAREDIASNNRQVDQALEALLGDPPSDADDPYFIGLDAAKGARYAATRPDASDWSAREPHVRDALRQLREDGYLEGVDLARPPDPDAEPDPARRRALRKEQTLVLSVNALEQALQQAPRLQKQLDGDRQWLSGAVGGRAVLVGWYATAQVADVVATPIDSQAPGVSVHGVIANGILTGELWKRSAQWVTLLITALAGVVTTLVVVRMPPAHALLASLTLVVGYVLFNGIVLFDRGNTIVGIAGPVTAVAAVWAGGTLSRLGIERKDRERIRRRFGNYVDPDLVNAVLEADDESIFRGAKRDMTVVFTDLQGFTALSEKLNEEIIPLLNEFMDRATKVIKRHRGFLNKFLGDGVLFFFNAPRNNPQYARDAIEAVLDMQRMVAGFSDELAARGLPRLGLRAGVTTGEMVVGDAGSEQRADYTVIGNLVNLAARLESANKVMGTSNLMIERTLDVGGKGFLVRPVGRLCVVGLSEGVMTYEAVCAEGDATGEQRRLVEMSREVVEAFLDARPADCLEAVTKMEEELGETKFTQVYREKCERYLQAPDAREFDRQIVLTEK